MFEKHGLFVQSVFRDAKGKGKAVPAQVWTGPTVSKISRLPYFHKFATEVAKVISPMHLPPLPTRIYSWYSFLLEAKSTPGT
jgi:hypothetical protein